MTRYERLAAALAALMLAGAACAPAPEAGPGTQPMPTGGMGGEFRDSHHARLRGTVTDARGAPLDSVEVVTLRLADRSRGSLARHRVRTDAAGRFYLPVGLIAPGGTDTATVEVVVRATAFPPRYPRPAPDTYYTAEIEVPVRVVPANREPTVVPVRLVVPVPQDRPRFDAEARRMDAAPRRRPRGVRRPALSRSTPSAASARAPAARARR